MSQDFDYLVGHSGSNIDLSKCGDINNGMTKMFDAIWSPDEVDSFDASCNTCKNFQRKPMTPEEKAERSIFGMPGRCELKSIPVRGWQRGQFCGFENADCYENRRTGMRPKDACRIEKAA
jgi:hypothetical protein